MSDHRAWLDNDDVQADLERHPSSVGGRRRLVANLRKAFAVAWSAETSACPDEWTPERPSRGQCAVTAMIVQDVLGGELMRVVNDGESHYFNWLHPADPLFPVEVDLTRQQYDTWDPSIPEVRTREYVESFPATMERYQLLCDQMPYVAGVDGVDCPLPRCMGTDDVALWAECFIETFPHLAYRDEIGDHMPLDVGTMIGWFANAMQAQRDVDAANRHAQDKPSISLPHPRDLRGAAPYAEV